MATSARRTLVTTAVATFARLTAEVRLDYTDAPERPTGWSIELTNRRGVAIGELQASGPFTTAREEGLVRWLRRVQQANQLPDDGDLFAMQVRHAIYTLIGMCYLERPDVLP